jgi:subtilisin family serine protease
MADDTRVTHSRAGLISAVALLCVMGCVVPAAAHADGIIVQRDPGLSAHERADVRADAGVKLEHTLSVPNVEVVEAPAGRAERALAALNRDPDVQFAVPGVRVHAAGRPWDPRYSEQWALDSGENPDISATEAWETASGQGAGVTVAVVDQIVNVDHPDLKPSIDQRYLDHPGDYDFTQPDGCTVSTPLETNDHGTHVAGTIAAQQDNGIGITGVAPYAKLLPLRALDNCGGGDFSWVLNAFAAAGEAQIPIVNASLGTDPLMPADEKARLNSLLAGTIGAYPQTLFVVAAGNEGNDNDELPVYPCNTLLPTGRPDNLICVGMTTRTDVPVCWGNVGANSVDLFAPGAEILSTVTVANGFDYRRTTGTSSAAARVSGAAALLKAEQGALFSASELHDRILRGVDPYDGMAAISVAGGRLNAERLVTDGRSLATESGGAWTSCDRDHDTVLNGVDACPDAPGPASLNGCPDTDGDGVLDGSDNCRAVANADQADTDADSVGNACDQMPRGDDPDGDGVPSLDDRCPAQAGGLPDGCPAVVNPPAPTLVPTVAPRPTPPPSIVRPQAELLSLKYKLSKCKKGKKKCRKVAKVTVKLSRQGRVALKVERRIRKRGRMVWSRVGRQKSLSASARGRSITVRGKSARRTTKYRVTATFAGKHKAVRFKV